MNQQRREAVMRLNNLLKNKFFLISSVALLTLVALYYIDKKEREKEEEKKIQHKRAGSDVESLIQVDDELSDLEETTLMQRLDFEIASGSAINYDGSFFRQRQEQISSGDFQKTLVNFNDRLDAVHLSQEKLLIDLVSEQDQLIKENDLLREIIRKNEESESGYSKKG